jgi:hypothetical protein
MRRGFLAAGAGPWTSAEQKLVGTMPDKGVARRIGRTLKAVWHRRLTLEAGRKG